MGMQTLKVWQGLQRDYQCLQIVQNDGNYATNVYTSGTTLSASVWLGADQSTIFSPTVSWYTAGGTQTGYTQGQFSVSFLAANTLTLDPAGEYHFLLTATTNGVSSPAWEGLVSVRATPGSTTPIPPDLITYDYCLGVLRQNSLTDEQIDVIPLLIPAASQLWRFICGELNFDQRTYIEWHDVSLDGYVRLLQTPVQVVARVQAAPTLALTVTNTSSSVQTAQAYFSYTASISGTTIVNKTATGITLNWVSNGTPSTTTLLFATYPTIGAMATAISAVGSGWSGQATTGYGLWACTELTNGFVAQGCSIQQPYPTDGALFNILSDIGNAQLNPQTPMLWVGQQNGGNINAGQWGPGGQELWGGYESQQQLGLAKVTYIAGYPLIPPDVQYQVCQLVKWKLELGIQELLLEMEKAADYEYKLDPAMAHAVPQPIREAAGQWKQHFA